MDSRFSPVAQPSCTFNSIIFVSISAPAFCATCVGFKDAMVVVRLPVVTFGAPRIVSTTSDEIMTCYYFAIRKSDGFRIDLLGLQLMGTRRIKMKADYNIRDMLNLTSTLQNPHNALDFVLTLHVPII